MIGQQAENAGVVENAETFERTLQQNAPFAHARRRVAERDKAFVREGLVLRRVVGTSPHAGGAAAQRVAGPVPVVRETDQRAVRDLRAKTPGAEL